MAQFTTLHRIRSLVDYLLFTALPSISNFLIVVVLVRRLTPTAFGVWALVDATLAVTGGFATLGSHIGLAHAVTRDEVSPARGLRTVLLGTLPMAPLVTLPVFYFFSAHSLLPAIVAFLNVLGDALSVSLVAAMRAQRKPRSVIAFECIRSGGYMVAILVSDRFMDHGSLDSVTMVFLVRAIAVLSADLVFMKRAYFTGLFELPLFRMLVGFGGNLLIASVVSQLMMNADRYLIELVGQHGAQELSMYVAHQRIAGLLSVAIVTPINAWYPIEAMRRDVQTEHRFYLVTFTLVVFAITLTASAALIICPLIWPFVFPRVNFSSTIFLVLVFSIIFQGSAILFNIGGLRRGRTHLNIGVSLASCAVCVLSGFPLVWAFGVTGAAVARLAGFATSAIAFRRVSHRVAHVAFPYRYVGAFVVGLVLASLGSQIGQMSAATALYIGAICSFALGLFWNLEIIKEVLVLSGRKPSESH